jgi:predicted ArsR family transcriptional regulator
MQIFVIVKYALLDCLVSGFDPTVRVTISDMAKLTGTSRNTLKVHFRQLLRKGHLVMHGRGRGAWYVLP